MYTSAICPTPALLAAEEMAAQNAVAQQNPRDSDSDSDTPQEIAETGYTFVALFIFSYIYRPVLVCMRFTFP